MIKWDNLKIEWEVGRLKPMLGKNLNESVSESDKHCFVKWSKYLRIWICHFAVFEKKQQRNNKMNGNCLWQNTLLLNLFIKVFTWERKLKVYLLLWTWTWFSNIHVQRVQFSELVYMYFVHLFICNPTPPSSAY